MACVLSETGTAYPSQAPTFKTFFFGGVHRAAHLFSFFYILLVSGAQFCLCLLIAPSVFSNVYS